MKRNLFYASSIILFLYFAIKHAVYYEHQKFGGGVYMFMTPLIYFGPAFLFLLSSYLFTISLPERRNNVRLLLCVVISFAGCSAVHSFYDTLNPFITGYFDQLNTGYSFPKAEDFRLEFFLLLLLNIVAFFLFVGKKIGRNSIPV